MDHKRIIEEIYEWRTALYRAHRGIDIIRAMEERIKNEPDEAKLKPLNFVLAEEYETQGDHAAADAIRRQDPIDEVYLWVEDVERTNGGPELIEAIKERIRTEPDLAKRRELNFVLAREHRREQDYAAAEAIYIQLFEPEPGDPEPLIQLAEQKLYYEDEPAEAMRVIDRAIDAGFRSGRFRRNALSVKARIAMASKDYQAVQCILTQIMQLGFERGNIDTGIARDFFDRLPAGSIDPEVARQYDEFCRDSRANS